MLSKHDELLLKDLKQQPIWLLGLYVVLGLVAVAIGMLQVDARLPALLCVGGGFLIALGAEKLVTRRIRVAALNLIDALPAAIENNGEPEQAGLPPA